MRINADFSRRVIIPPSQHQWLASPQAGVERVMLDRIGAEKARATSLVRYAPGSHFPQHGHPDGEEIFVLSGTFSEGDAHYSAGSYLRSPPGSGHQPYSGQGAVIFVKLRQMPAHERRTVRLDTSHPALWQRLDGREVCPLFASDYEQVCLQRLGPNATLRATSLEAGAEVLVLEGEVHACGQTCPRSSWLRFPAGGPQYEALPESLPESPPLLVAGAQGACVYVKTGHLRASAQTGADGTFPALDDVPASG